MGFNPEQLSYAGRAAIDFYLKNEPVDQINITHPFAKKMIDAKKEYPGGKQYVVEQLRYSNSSNFQPYFGDGQVTYNRKRTIEQAQYGYGSWHDGFALNEDELVANGISLTDDRGAAPSANEKVALEDLFKENMETLKLGFQENFDLMLHRNGAQNALDIPGLDALVSLSPSAGTIGGISAANAWWQNYANAAVEASSEGILDSMERAWRACILYGGNVPDFILAGADWIDEYRDATFGQGGAVQRQVIVGGSTGNKTATTVDGSVGAGLSTGLYFKGIEIIWDPVFEQLDAEDTPTVPWSTRCYFLNTKFLKLRPINGQWMVPRRPPRVYDRYVHYWGLTAKAALTTSKRNAHAVLALA